MNEVVQYYNNRAKVFIAQRQYEKAVEDSTHALTLDPQNLSAYCRRSFTYLLMEAVHEAWCDCEKALQLDSVHPRLYYIRACLQMKQQLFRYCCFSLSLVSPSPFSSPLPLNTSSDTYILYFLLQ